MAWLIAFIAFVFAINKAFSLADTLTSGTLTFSAPSLFSFGRSTSPGGQVTLSMHADARSIQHQLPLRKLEDARAVEAAGIPLKKHRAINSVGKVSCLVSDAGMQYLLGFFELERADAWARPFLAQQDAADLQTVKTQVKTWGAGAQQSFDDCGLLFSERTERSNKQFAALNLTFYEQLFAPSALYHMALRNIAPSEALYAIHSGREESSGFGAFRNLWATRRYRELSCNVQVLVQKHTIVAVARANNDFVETPSDGAGMLAFYQKSTEFRDAFWAKEKQKQQLEEVKSVSASAPQPEPELPDEPDDENKPKDPNRPKEPNECIKIDEKRTHHIFRKSEGHFPSDTPENRKLLEDLVNDKKNYHGPDRHGNSVYGKILENGKQVWAYLRNGCIHNGGINETPLEYNPETGFSALKKPI